MENSPKQQPEESTHFIIDMPEVKDIPGQEHIKPPRMNEMADVTISSSDEEGEGILDDLNREEGDEDILDNTISISHSEREALARTDRPISNETADVSTTVDNIDDEDDPLNEQSNSFDMGKDLDVPGSEMDNRNENVGEEDEENNEYSRRD